MEKYLRPERFDVDPASSSDSSTSQWLHWKATFENFLSVASPSPADGDQECQQLMDATKYQLLINNLSATVYNHVKDAGLLPLRLIRLSANQSSGQDLASNISEQEPDNKGESKMSGEPVNIARRRLAEALGDDNMAVYLGHMKTWFKMKFTKLEFDTEARALLSPDQVHLHNEFLLALLNKVDGLAELSVASSQERSTHRSNSRRHKRGSRSTSEKSSFEPADILEYLPSGSPTGSGGDGVRYAVQDLFLPDHSLVVGRFMLAAWEHGLDGAHDDAAHVVLVALQNFLKNILSAVISQRKGYKTRDNFVYDVGSGVPNIWLRNTRKLVDPQADGRTDVDESGNHIPRMLPNIDEVEHNTALEIACSVPKEDNQSNRLTMSEFYQTLLVHRNVIASHSIYAVNMERIVTMLNHPSY